MINYEGENGERYKVKITPDCFIKKFQGTENVGNSCYFQTAIRLLACHPVWMHYLKLLHESGLADQPEMKNGKIDGKSTQTKECFLRKLYELVREPEIKDVKHGPGKTQLAKQQALFREIYRMYQAITDNTHNVLDDQGSCNEAIIQITDMIEEAVWRKKILDNGSGPNEKNKPVYGTSLYPSCLVDKYNIPLGNNVMPAYSSSNQETHFSLNVNGQQLGGCANGKQLGGYDFKCFISNPNNPYYTGSLATKTFNDIVMLSDVATLLYDDDENGRIKNVTDLFSVPDGKGGKKVINVNKASKVKDIKKVFINDEEYTLACFACHTGWVNGGHYTAYVYNNLNDKTLTNFNDGGQDKYNEGNISIEHVDYAMYIKTDALNKGKINI